jgi:serine/threonine protein kinase
MAIAGETKFAGRFAILAEQKQGGTARIYRAFDYITNSLVALKIFITDGRDHAVVNEIWNREQAALSKIQHESIVRMVGAGRSEVTSERFIALEWVDGVTLEDHLKNYGPMSWESFFDRLGKPILSALVFATERNVTHRDLSTGNVLITTDQQVKIIDFGQAKLANVGIGLTVMHWKTVPYCLPEEDTGTYTYTRDPYAFCAIAIRAISGKPLANHEELYRELERVSLPPTAHEAVMRALSRVPSERFKTIVEFGQAINAVVNSAPDIGRSLMYVRFSPGLNDRIAIGEEQLESNISVEDAVLSDLNDVVAASPTEKTADSGRILLETPSYRLVAMPDSASGDHLVIIDIIRKRFRLDALFQSERWLPQVHFSSDLPRSASAKRAAGHALEAFYQGLEAFLDERSQAERRDGNRAISGWGRLLEALRYLAKNSVPPLRYIDIERDGNRLIATLENPDDAAEEEMRVISVDRSWVFRGEVESVRDNKCVLLSTRPYFEIDRIPAKGELEIDWQQTKVALDRQARAVDKFKLSETPSSRVHDLLTGTNGGELEPAFGPVAAFFDKSLDDAKKSIVSRFAAGTELIVTHGPPGTGKTKLIVELIRQAIRSNPDCRILLASQTHVALDNALERLLASDKEVSCVRIGSGSKDADARVASSSLEQRSEALRAHVTQSALKFIEERAADAGIDRKEVQLGLYALDLMGALAELQRAGVSRVEVEAEIEALSAKISNETPESANERSAHAIRARVLDEELERVSAELVLSRAEANGARQKLVALGGDGPGLAKLTSDELREWSQVLLGDKKSQALGELMQLSESWRQRFAQSDDFKAAIISSSSVVAGTCVGFCREEAALRTTFDLCIIDEAGKATTTELLVPLAQSRRAVLFGDHHQLPAVLDHAIRSVDLKDRFGLSESELDEHLFEKLTKTLEDGCKASLTVQYRMRGEIGRLVSECFYKGALKEDESLRSRQVANLSLAGLDTEVTWIDPYPHSVQFDEQSRGTSFENAREAQSIVALLKRLLFAFQRDLTGVDWPSIGVISGYAPQINSIRNAIRKEPELDRLNVECASVHAFQGREVDICVYSVTRKNARRKIGMLKDWRHLNVALSRAKNFLVIVGSVEFCREAEEPNPFSRIISFIEESPICVIKEWSDD